METGNQYAQDSAKLAALIERYTGIPKERVFFFVMENAAAELLPCANLICDTDKQREKLAALFEFKNLYEAVKSAEQSRTHALNDTQAAIGYFKNRYADANDRERFSAAFLDSQHRVIAAKEMFAGTVGESAVHPREIIKEVLFYNAASVMLAHNHPGGSERPSQADIAVTARIKQSMDAVGVKLLDHIIIAGNRAVSLAETGHIPATAAPLIPMAASPVREKGSRYQAKTQQPSIKQKIAAGKNQLATDRAAKPARAAAKTKSNALEV
jgi:DNA repair protein RadC